MPNKLSDLQIDEISLVYKGANQHSRVAIAKSLDGQQEETVEIFDQDGNPVDPDALELGDIVFDADGDAFQVSDDDEEENEYDDERELQTIGKAGSAGTGAKLFGSAFKPTKAGSRARGLSSRARTAGRGAKMASTSLRGVGRSGAGAIGGAAAGGASSAKAAGTKAWDIGSSHATAGAFGAARGVKRAAGNRGFQLGAAGAAGVGGGAAGSEIYNRNIKKSFSDEMRSELSKALSDDDRDEVIAKAFDYVSYLEEVAKSAEQVASEERTTRRQGEYLEIAKSFNLPVSDEQLADAMMAAEDALEPEQVEVLAQCLSAASDVLFNEIGAQGGGTSSFLMDQIEDYANHSVAKSADGTKAEAISKAFTEDPSLYDRYLEDTGRYNR